MLRVSLMHKIINLHDVLEYIKLDIFSAASFRQHRYSVTSKQKKNSVYYSYIIVIASYSRKGCRGGFFLSVIPLYEQFGQSAQCLLNEVEFYF